MKYLQIKPSVSLQSVKLLVIAALCVVAVVLVAFGHPLFLTNDGGYMKVVVSGESTGTPVSQLYFSSRALAVFLATLYSVLPWIQWYAWLQLLTILAASAILIVSLRQKGEVLSWAVFLGLITCIAALRPDYTFTSLVGTALASTAFWIGARQENCRGTTRIPRLLGALALVAFAASWRPNAALLGLAVLLPGLLAVIAHLRLRVASLMPYIVTICSFFLQEMLRRTQPGAWREWETYNRVRGELHGPRLELGEFFTESAGWSVEGLRTFRRFATVDEDIFNIEALIRLDSALPLVGQNLDGDLLGTAFSGASLLANYSLVFLSLLVLFTGTHLAAGKSFHPNSILLLLIFPYWFLLILALASVRLPTSLLFPLILSMGVTVGLLFSIAGSDQLQVKWRLTVGRTMLLAASISLVLITFFGGQGVLTSYSEGKRLADIEARYLTDLAETSSCSSFVATPGAVGGMSMTNPYGTSAVTTLPYLTLGWAVNSPAWQERAATVLMGRKVLESLLVRQGRLMEPSTCLIATASAASDYSALINQLEYGYFLPIKIQQVLEPHHQVFIWRFVEVA